jgi:hypothetical protein
MCSVCVLVPLVMLDSTVLAVPIAEKDEWEDVVAACVFVSGYET